MSGAEPTPLFVDTGPFYARFDADDALHDQTVDIFERIRTGDLLYRTAMFFAALQSAFTSYPQS